MIKTFCALAVFGLVQSTNTVEVSHTADVFNMKNFLKSTTPMNLMKGLVEQRVVKDGKVVFASCTSDAKDFIPDMSATYASPAVVTKGINVGFNLGGLMSQATDVTNVDINVLWNGTPLHKEDHAMDQKINANGLFKYNLSWAVPSFAPSGHYAVTITVSGEPTGVTAAESIGCMTANFDL